VHEAQAYNIIIANIGSQTVWKWYRCFLAPLVEDLKIMWEKGVEVFDAYHLENFKLQSMLLWTINDFSVYKNLSGYTVKGHKACPVCKKDIFSLQLKHDKKTLYLGSQRFLPKSHHYQELQKFLMDLRRRKSSKGIDRWRGISTGKPSQSKL